MAAVMLAMQVFVQQQSLLLEELPCDRRLCGGFPRAALLAMLPQQVQPP